MYYFLLLQGEPGEDGHMGLDGLPGAPGIAGRPGDKVIFFSYLYYEFSK